MLQILCITKWFGDVKVLDRIHFTIKTVATGSA